MRQLVARIQRIYSLTVGLELNALGLALINIIGTQVGRWLVQGHVELSWARPIDVPVLISELRLVDNARAMNFRFSSFDIVSPHVN